MVPFPSPCVDKRESSRPEQTAISAAGVAPIRLVASALALAFAFFTIIVHNTKEKPLDLT